MSLPNWSPSGRLGTAPTTAMHDWPACPQAFRALLVDADPALAGLIDEWLAPQGGTVVQEQPGGLGGHNGFDLIVVDVPFPRQGGSDLLRRLKDRHSGTPILALSSNFFPGVGGSGAVARSLGVAGVLAKPVTREALVGAVDKLLNPAT